MRKAAKDKFTFSDGLHQNKVEHAMMNFLLTGDRKKGTPSKLVFERMSEDYFRVCIANDDGEYLIQIAESYINPGCKLTIEGIQRAFEITVR
jgi:hypothetical protein